MSDTISLEGVSLNGLCNLCCRNDLDEQAITFYVFDDEEDEQAFHDKSNDDEIFYLSFSSTLQAQAYLKPEIAGAKVVTFTVINEHTIDVVIDRENKVTYDYHRGYWKGYQDATEGKSAVWDRYGRATARPEEK